MNSGSATIRRLGMMMIPLAAAILLLAGFQYMLVRAEVTVQAAQALTPASPVLSEKIITVVTTGTISIIDTATDIVYGPFLSGSLGSQGGGLFDVEVTPDGNTALISNFGDSAIFFVDISDPFSPTFIISVTTPMFAEDIAISPDGRFALVTDGGFSPYVATIDLISRTLIYTTNLDIRYSQAVAIAPNGTVLLADYWNSELHALKLNASGTLSYTGSYSYTIGTDGIFTETSNTAAQLTNSPVGMDPKFKGSPSEPLTWQDPSNLPRFLNVGIAPDGQTVIVCSVAPYTSTNPPNPLYATASFSVGVYRITAPGVLSSGGVITGLSRATQSVAFSAAGDKAYLAGNGGGTDTMANDQLTVLDISGPGIVHLEQDGAADYLRFTGSQLFGVDTIAVGNGNAYLGFPTLSGATNIMRIIHLNDFSVYKRTLDGIPTGVDVIPIKKLFLPIINKP